MSEALIIVESPAKARTISKFVGSDYIVESSIGHIRDLPSKKADLPAEVQKKSWARMGVNIEEGFAPIYVVPPAKKAQVKKLKALLKNASALYLATDEDREGEAIAWHLLEVLKPKVPVKRMVFHEITKKAIGAALDNPREIDSQLVSAQEARRILDRLYGYEVSPVLWRKVKPRLSAGRVQSVATRLVVDRERARLVFRSADYSSVDAELDASPKFRSDLISVGGRRVAVGRHFEATTGSLTESATKENVIVLSESDGALLSKEVEGGTVKVQKVTKKPFKQRPYAPFITSTLQQEAGRKLGFAAKRTMRIAQGLYENGYITYMRTDSTSLSEQAVDAARKQIASIYGNEYLPDAPRVYKKKVKGAQEAHEAIRPAGEEFRLPENVKSELDADQFKIYDLIWKRTVACQMKDSQGERTQVRFSFDGTHASAWVDGADRQLIFSASGKVITFPGYLRAYVQGSDDPDAELEDREKLLPAMTEGNELSIVDSQTKAHATKPPSRYSEAALVKELEERGIGRPSTYASIIQTIQDRGYIWKQGGALVPTLTAFAVTNLLETHFRPIVEYAFTARMESDLDAISNGTIEAKPWLHEFYFGADGAADRRDSDMSAPKGEGDITSAVGLHPLVSSGVEEIDARSICSLPIGETEDGMIMARVGRYGPYLQVGDSEVRATLSSAIPVDELDVEKAKELLRQAAIANRPLGKDPETGKDIFIKTGAYGPYVQLGEPELTPKGNIKKGSKPKMASLWPDMSVDTITLDQAQLLLSFPKILGQHPEHGVDIVVQDGPYGPYILMVVEGKKDSRQLEDHEQMRKLDLAGALALFKEPKKRRSGQSRNQVLKSLGTSAVTEKSIDVKNGRFGPYVTDGVVNATIPASRNPETITLDDALELIAAREEKMREQGKDPRKKKVSIKRIRKPKSTTKKTVSKRSKK